MPNVRAFTLLEMLVVLVIVSLISLLLFDMLDYVLQLRVRFSAYTMQMQQGAMKAHWFRSSTQALIPAYPDQKAALFSGNAKKFSGLTILSLEAEAGVPMRFAWELREQNGWTVLAYRPQQESAQDEKIWPIMQWVGGEGRFQYLDEAQQWHEQWPPVIEDVTQFAKMVQFSQLPQAIVLYGLNGQRPLTWLVAIDGQKKTPQDASLLE